MEIWSSLVSFGLLAALMATIPGLDNTLVLRSAISRVCSAWPGST
ncbi:hypothetical protein [Microlunatus parietis]|uniref:Threonine/homoserine/homoserine lactone efflux protein n=1 Tax=Microlunatus parietis TaxID=682979 RepID=A0A7Y9IC20_9ACTN|nr:hypothetical protein [Microlunatus parietis]NYE73534.1 threonine/homoserine/homoserine lactone efflux protein [Microlunatus parietis]